MEAAFEAVPGREDAIIIVTVPFGPVVGQPLYVQRRRYRPYALYWHHLCCHKGSPAIIASSPTAEAGQSVSAQGTGSSLQSVYEVVLQPEVVILSIDERKKLRSLGWFFFDSSSCCYRQKFVCW
jgi:hypothetical protein